MKQLDVVVPGLLGPFANAVPAYISQQLEQAEFNQLNQFLTRAKKNNTHGETYFETLVDLICPQCDLSLCQLSAEFDGVDIADGFFYRADPVHFKAESDHAVLIGTDLISPTDFEARQLVECFNQHFLDDKITLHLSHKDRWYLKSHRPLELRFTALDYALGRDIKHFMPQDLASDGNGNGKGDGLWWRKILNEAQMLFFQHAVNQTREEQGELTINGLWLWDMPAFSASDKKSQICQLFADDAIAVALGNQSGISALAVNDMDISDIECNEASTVIVLNSLYESVCYGDVDAWLDELRRFCKNEFRQLMNLLSTKQVDEIKLYPCNGQVFKISRTDLMRFWNKQQTIDRFMFTDKML